MCRLFKLRRVPQTPELRLAKRAIAARLLRLPPGIQALPLRRQLVGLCDACGEEAEAEDNLMVECDKCRVMVSDQLPQSLAAVVHHAAVAAQRRELIDAHPLLLFSLGDIVVECDKCRVVVRRRVLLHCVAALFSTPPTVPADC